MKVWGFYRGSGHLPHRAEVQAVGSQGDLKTGDLGIDARRRRRRRKHDEQEDGEAESPPHGRWFSPRRLDSSS